MRLTSTHVSLQGFQSICFDRASKPLVYKVTIVCVFKQEECSSRFGDIRGGEAVVGELSLSSLKLKLFLLRDSAPVRKREQTKKADRLDKNTHR